MNIPILLLHQYSSEIRSLAKPELGALMGGQGIHNTPQQVLALWRKEDVTQLYELKRRGGCLEKEPFTLVYNRQYARYESTTVEGGNDESSIPF